jgi:hypothetical protein
MSLSRVCLALMLPAALSLWACGGPNFIAKDEPWRAEDERACLQSGIVRESRFVEARASLGGPSVCGAIRPFSVAAAAQGSVELRPAALLRCPMVPALDYWVERVVRPAARYHLRSELVEIKVAASYSCRGMNGIRGARLSEHGHANAVDISAFILADGRPVHVKTGWHGAWAERNFLRQIHRGACEVFTTVLGPNHDAFHRDHFHLDLARHGRDGSGRICK